MGASFEFSGEMHLIGPPDLSGNRQDSAQDELKQFAEKVAARNVV